MAFLSAFRTRSQQSRYCAFRTRRVGDPQIGAQEGGTELGNQSLHGVGVIAETLAELAIAAGLSACPVNELMQLGRGISFENNDFFWGQSKGNAKCSAVLNERMPWRAASEFRCRSCGYATHTFASSHKSGLQFWWVPILALGSA